MSHSHGLVLGGALLFAFEGAVCFAAASIDARWMEGRVRRRSHLLGHWLGLHFAAGAGPPLVLWAGMLLGAWEAGAGAFLASGAAGAAALLLGLKMIGRDRRALALGFLLTLNPVLWWAGAVYLRRRRAELRPAARARGGLTSPPPGPSARP